MAICSLLGFIMSYYIANDAINLFNQINSKVFVDSSEPWGAIAVVRNFSIVALLTYSFFAFFSFLPAVEWFGLIPTTFIALGLEFFAISVSMVYQTPNGVFSI